MLTGKFTALRAIERNDLSTLLQWRNTPFFRRHFREYRELSGDMQLEWFEKTALADPSTRMFAIVDLEAGNLLGACGLCYIDWVNRNADFSIYIGKDGLYIDDLYAPDAADIMMRYAVDELNLYRLWSEIYDFDEHKKTFFAKLGFTHEGTHRSTHWTAGKWVDSLFYGILCNEYSFSKTKQQNPPT